MKSHLFIILLMLLIVINISFSLSCAHELQNGPGTCIDKTYTMIFSGTSAYYSCNTIHDTFWYYEDCTATVSDGLTFSDNGNIIATAYSNELNKVSACKDNDGFYCNVNPVFGFSTNMSALSVGYCDSSEETCVKCSDEHVEIKNFDGSGTFRANINGIGDNECESGCGAQSICDEILPTTWSNRQNNNSVFEAYCNESCFVDNLRCRTDYGAHNLCDYKFVNDVCNSDSCDVNNRLIDYNGNNVFDDVYCSDSCDCDTTVDSLLCDSECGASMECEGFDIGYNLVNQGCNNSCIWKECGLNIWNDITNECLTTCENNSQCYESAVCDLVNENINNCIIDNVSPNLTYFTPINNFRTNNHIINYSFIVTDDSDLFLNCSYILNNNSINIGDVSQNETFNNSFNVNEDRWNSFKINCSDDSRNYNISNEINFLSDFSQPTYSNFNYIDLTPTIDNSLIVNDNISINAIIYDNFELNYTEIWSNRSGIWEKEVTFNDELNNEDNISYIFNTTSYGDKTISFKLIIYDSSNNSKVSDELLVHVYSPLATISAVVNEDSEGDYENTLEYIGNGQALINEKAIDSIHTEYIGDFNITHEGIGTTINITYKLNNSLIPGINMKISSEYDPSTAKYLTEEFQDLNICNELVPGQTCRVWMWMDMIDSIPPNNQFNEVILHSKSI